MILKLAKEVCKMTLEHIIGSESKEVLKKKAQKKICLGEMVSQIKEFQVVKSETISATK